MKKLFLLLFGLLTISSCCDDDDPKVKVVDFDKIVGDWVYDSPTDGVWETMRFTSSGVFYYSNDMATWNFSNDRNDGRYTIDEKNNTTTITYTLNGEAKQDVMTFQSLNEYEFTAKFQQTGLSFTYGKLLGSQKLVKPGDKVTPDYKAWVSDEIRDYSSHDLTIATVDDKTGEITAVAENGRTYINVYTTKGRALVEVVINDETNYFGDYSWAFGKTIDDIINKRGSNYYAKVDNQGITYKSKNLYATYERYLTGTIDDSHVQDVQLVLNDRLTDTQITTMLEKKYKSLGKLDGTDVNVYYDDSSSSMYFVMYDPTERTLSFTLSAFWPDFVPYFGLTSDEVRERMTNNGHQYFEYYDSYSANGSESYLLTSHKTKVFAVEFVYNKNNVVCSYFEYLTSSVKDTEVLEHLKSIGMVQAYNETTTGNAGSVFYNAARTLKVEYDLLRNALVFTDLKRDAYTPVILGSYWKMLGKTASEVKAYYGKPDAENSSGTVMRYITMTDYVSYVQFALDSSKKVYNINVFTRDHVEDSVVKNFLNSIYKPFDSGTNDNGPYNRWISGSTRETSDMMITFYPDYNVVVYQHPSTASSRPMHVLSFNQDQ